MIKNYTDHSANERTFLAWVRTAIAIVGFGLAAARLGSGNATLWSESLLLASGGIVILIAYLRMRRLKKRIASEREFDDGSLAPDALLVVLVVALLALLAFFGLHVS
jgi:inner membrane protein YidH